MRNIARNKTTTAKNKKQKTKDGVKEELLKSIRESHNEYDSSLDEVGENVMKLKDAVQSSSNMRMP